MTISHTAVIFPTKIFNMAWISDLNMVVLETFWQVERHIGNPGRQGQTGSEEVAVEVAAGGREDGSF